MSSGRCNHRFIEQTVAEVLTNGRAYFPIVNDKSQQAIMPPARRNVIDLMQRLDAAPTIAAMWDEFKKFAKRNGYEFVCFGDLPTGRQHLRDVIFLTNFPGDWRKHYYEQDYVTWDPAASYLRRATRPYTLKDIVRSDLYGPKQMQIVNEATEFGLKSMFLVPLRNGNDEPAFLSLADRVHYVPSARTRVDLHLAAFYFNMRIRPFLGAPDQPLLTDRERECLQWVALGKSDSAIGDILGISGKTVNFHVEGAKRKFQVSSRTVAAALAVKAGIVDV